MTTVCIPYEDNDERIRELYLNPKVRIIDIAAEVGHSKTYVINRVAVMVKRGELTPRCPRPR